MTRRLLRLSAIVLVLTTALSITPALAIDEPERLWMVGERAFADGLYPLARRTLGRLVDRYPRDERLGPALLMLGRAHLELREFDTALDAFRRAQKVEPAPGHPLEARFWEGEVLYRLKRYSEARAAYDQVLRTDMTAPFAGDALYGYGWTELDLNRPEPAATAFRDLLQAWPKHPQAASVTYHLGRLLVELKRPAEAVPVLADYATKYPDSKHKVDAQYLLGIARIDSGDTRKGVADLRQFIAANPSHEGVANARRQVTQATVQSGDKSELAQAYASLMSDTPTAEGLADAATIAGKLGRRTDQDAAIKKLVAHFPAHPLAHRAAFEQVQAAYKRKDWQEAVTWADAASRSEEDAIRAESWLLAGESELKLKRYGPAAKAFESVGAVKGVSGDVRYRALAGLGLAREEQNELRQALAAYDAVAKKGPDPALRDWARDRAAAIKARMKPSPSAAPSTKPKSH